MTEHYYSLIIKDLQGSINDKEKEELERWKKDKPEEYLEIKKIYEHSKLDIKDIGHSNFDDSRIRELPYKTLLIAAIVLITFTISYFNYFTATETVVNSKSLQTVLLPDQTLIYLDKNSSLKYQSNFTENNRHIRFSGAAFFKVKSDIHNTFVIELRTSKITVTGTTFNLRSNKDSTLIDMDEGKITYTVNNKSYSLVGKQSLKDISGKILIHELKDKKRSEWMKLSLDYTNEPVQNIIEFLENHYQTRIYIEEKSVREKNISIHITKKSLDQILEALAESLNLKLNYNQNHFIISKR